jgi:VanZ family protein
VKAAMMKFWWGLGLVLVAVATYYCLVPADEIPGAFDFNDKINHVLGHGLLAIYFTGLVARPSWWKVFVFLLVFGVAIEFAQYYMGLGRQGDARDVLANCTGAALGLLLARLGLSRWTQWAAWLLGRRVTQ